MVSDGGWLKCQEHCVDSLSGVCSCALVLFLLLASASTNSPKLLGHAQKANMSFWEPSFSQSSFVVCLFTFFFNLSTRVLANTFDSDFRETSSFYYLSIHPSMHTCIHPSSIATYSFLESIPAVMRQRQLSLPQFDLVLLILQIIRSIVQEQQNAVSVTHPLHPPLVEDIWDLKPRVTLYE